jgi:hypothetical protein
MLYDAKYCWRHITKLIPSIVAVVQHVCQVTLSTSLHTHTHTHINRLYTIPSIVGGILQSVLNLIQCVKVLRGVKMAEPCERTPRNRRRNANESLVEKLNTL